MWNGSKTVPFLINVTVQTWCSEVIVMEADVNGLISKMKCLMSLFLFLNKKHDGMSDYKTKGSVMVCTSYV